MGVACHGDHVPACIHMRGIGGGNRQRRVRPVADRARGGDVVRVVIRVVVGNLAIQAADGHPGLVRADHGEVARPGVGLVGNTARGINGNRALGVIDRPQRCQHQHGQQQQ